MAFVLGFRQSPLSNMSFSSRPRWELALASAPLWPIGWLILFASAARVKLGYWPSDAHPDPTTLHWFPADFMVLPLLLFSPIAVFASVIVAIFQMADGRSGWSVCLKTMASFGVLFLWLRFDPGGFFVWWAD
jgi:hypothetical protein